MQKVALEKLNKLIGEKLLKLKETSVARIQRVMLSRQTTHVIFENREILNFSSGNYMGLSSHPAVIKNSIELTTSRGVGLSSPRNICGTQDIHIELEKTISKFHNREDAITYTSCMDANFGLFEALFDENDTIIFDEGCNYSIINGIKASKARNIPFRHLDTIDLEEKLKNIKKQSQNMLIATDGVFSLEGQFSPLNKICDLADKYEALTFIDDRQATGFIGETGRGSEEKLGVNGRIDILNSSLGKAVGGASGGYTASSENVVELLRKKSTPYIYGNALPPSIVGASLTAFEIIQNGSEILNSIRINTELFRTRMKEAGFTVLGEDHPICPILMPDEQTAHILTENMYTKGFLLAPITSPIVPKNKPIIRVQISASHTKEEIEKLASTLIDVGKELSLLK